jgi:hypothetical protein
VNSNKGLKKKKKGDAPVERNAKIPVSRFVKVFDE